MYTVAEKICVFFLFFRPLCLGALWPFLFMNISASEIFSSDSHNWHTVLYNYNIWWFCPSQQCRWVEPIIAKFCYWAKMSDAADEVRMLFCPIFLGGFQEHNNSQYSNCAFETKKAFSSHLQHLTLKLQGIKASNWHFLDGFIYILSWVGILGAFICRNEWCLLG